MSGERNPYKEAKLGVFQESAWVDMLLAEAYPTKDINVLKTYERDFPAVTSCGPIARRVRLDLVPLLITSCSLFVCGEAIPGHIGPKKLAGVSAIILLSKFTADHSDRVGSQFALFAKKVILATFDLQRCDFRG